MINDLWHLIKTDKRYWQFPIALSILTVGAMYGAMRLFHNVQPAYFTIFLAFCWVVLSTFVTWWLLLDQDARKKGGS